MNNIQEQKDKAILSGAAYTNFFDKDGQKIADNKTLEGSLRKYSSFSDEDIKYFTDNFEVIHQQLETASGFLSVL